MNKKENPKTRKQLQQECAERAVQAGFKRTSVNIHLPTFDVGYYAGLAGRPVTDVPKTNSVSWVMGHAKGIAVEIEDDEDDDE
jgi:hypothetical protein